MGRGRLRCPTMSVPDQDSSNEEASWPTLGSQELLALGTLGHAGCPGCTAGTFEDAKNHRNPRRSSQEDSLQAPWSRVGALQKEAASALS